MDYKAQFSKFLKEHRLERAANEKRDITQADIAREIGVSTSTYNRWELGDNLPKPEQYPLLMHYYGRPILRVLGLPEPTEHDEGLRELLAIWKDLSEDQRRQLIETARRRGKEGGPDRSNFQLAGA
jgi:transcriptional regulator with XRE-family HTH domain